MKSVAGFFLDEDLDFGFAGIEEIENELEAVASSGAASCRQPQMRAVGRMGTGFLGSSLMAVSGGSS